MSAGAFVDGARERAARSKRPTSSSSAPARAAARRRACWRRRARASSCSRRGRGCAPSELGVVARRVAHAAVSQPGQAGGVRPRDDADPAGALRRRHDLHQLGDRVAAAGQRARALAPRASGSPRRCRKRRSTRRRRASKTELSARAVVEGDTAGNGRICCCAPAARSVGIEGRFIHRYEKGCRGSGRCLHGCPQRGQAVDRGRRRCARAVADGGYRRRATRASSASSARRTRRRRARALRRRRARARAALSHRRAPRRHRRRRRASRSSNLLWRSGVRARASRRATSWRIPGTALMGLYRRSRRRVDRRVAGLRSVRPARHARREIRDDQRAARGDGGAAARRRRALRASARRAAARRQLGGGAQGRRRRAHPPVAAVRRSGALRRRRAAISSGCATPCARCAEMHFAAGAREVVTGVAGLPETLTSPDQLALFDDAPLDPRAYSLVMTHLFGGCRAGKDAGDERRRSHAQGARRRRALRHGRERVSDEHRRQSAALAS